MYKRFEKYIIDTELLFGFSIYMDDHKFKVNVTKRGKDQIDICKDISSYQFEFSGEIKNHPDAGILKSIHNYIKIESGMENAK